MKYKRNPRLPLERELMSSVKGKIKLGPPPLFLAFLSSKVTSKRERVILSPGKKLVLTLTHTCLLPDFMLVGKALQPDTNSQGFCHPQSSKNSKWIHS